MDMESVIGVADAAYGDGLVRRCRRSRRPCGDTLALFIARELEECVAGVTAGGRAPRDTEQLEEARRDLCAARRQVQCVERAFEAALDAARKREAAETEGRCGV